MCFNMHTCNLYDPSFLPTSLFLYYYANDLDSRKKLGHIKKAAFSLLSAEPG